MHAARRPAVLPLCCLPQLLQHSLAFSVAQLQESSRSCGFHAALRTAAVCLTPHPHPRPAHTPALEVVLGEPVERAACLKVCLCKAARGCGARIKGRLELMVALPGEGHGVMVLPHPRQHSFSPASIIIALSMLPAASACRAPEHCWACGCCRALLIALLLSSPVAWQVHHVPGVVDEKVVDASCLACGAWPRRCYCA